MNKKCVIFFHSGKLVTEKRARQVYLQIVVFVFSKNGLLAL